MAMPSTVPSTLGGKETREKDSQRNKVDEPQITLSGDKTPGTQTDTKVRESEPVVHQWGGLARHRHCELFVGNGRREVWSAEPGDRHAGERKP